MQQTSETSVTNRPWAATRNNGAATIGWNLTGLGEDDTISKGIAKIRWEFCMGRGEKHVGARNCKDIH